MAIEKAKLFERTRERWPLTVRVYPRDEVPRFETIPSLVEIYRAIEAACEPAGEWTAQDEWSKLANWAFHQALWTLAERAGDTYLNRNEVTFELFDKCIRENLTDDCWNAERIEYEESPSFFH